MLNLGHIWGDRYRAKYVAVEKEGVDASADVGAL